MKHLMESGLQNVNNLTVFICFFYRLEFGLDREQTSNSSFLSVGGKGKLRRICDLLEIKQVFVFLDHPACWKTGQMVHSQYSRFLSKQPIGVCND